MRVLELVSGYLWSMVMIQSFILITIDSNYYKKSGFRKSAKAAKIIGISLMVIFTILYMANKLIFRE